MGRKGAAFLSIAIALSFLSIIVSLFAPGAVVSAEPDQLTIRVGVYDNPPKVTYDQSAGEAGGFIPEILEAIAAAENWRIEYVYGDWVACLDRLQSGEIDVMVDVAYSEERATLYDLSAETVFTNWAVVYASPDTQIESITDLEGKKVAVMEASIHTEGEDGIRALAAGFDVDCTFVVVDSYAEVFRLLDSSEADAGVVNRLFGETIQEQFDLKRTGIFFNPSELRFAFPKNAALNPLLAAGIDRNLAAMKADRNSAYYSILDSYFGKAAKVFVIPGWVLWAAWGSAAAILLLVSMGLLLKWQVNRRTRELKASLGQSEELQYIINKSPSVVFLWRNEAGWPIEMVSDNIVLFGYAPEEFTSGTINYADVIHPEDRERVMREAEEHSQGHVNEFSQTYRISMKSGQVRWVEDHRFIRRDETGKITHYQGIVTDVTQRKRAEDELKEHTQELRDFLTVAAHELRHPITIMAGYADVLMDHLKDVPVENIAAICRAVKMSGDRLNNALNDLLDVSRIEQGTFVAMLEEVNPFQIAKKAIRDMCDAGCANPIRLLPAEGGEGSISVHADPAKLIRLLVLLLDNAAKFSAAGATIDVEISGEEGEVEVAVLDHGIGIPQAASGKVFDRFFQVEAVDHHSTRGLGMGLYIAREIVAAHGGKIWCEPREGGGTIFRFVLPEPQPPSLESGRLEESASGRPV
ncbi:MAG: ATP-binding protein [Candidatus Geothermincolia bacterium]